MTDGRIEPTTMLVLLLAITLATAGQLLLKAGMDQAGVVVDLTPRAIGGLVRSVLTSWRLLAGLAAFGVSSVFWLASLSRLPLSTAYPVVSLSYVFILLFSTLLLGERPSVTVWSGAGLIMLGVSLIGIGQR
jgi:drug/metabolite transporter (DMT)-like permease